ncbi:MAG TPA: hypothetical protein VJK27_09040 [Terriglobales bacterium]|nr:hypothetical protein [Terriglobales bacterium]
MKTPRLLALTLLMVAPVLGQDPSSSATLSKTPGEVDVRKVDVIRDETRMSGHESNDPRGELNQVVSANGSMSAVALVSLPDAPAPQPVRRPVIDKKFIAVMAALGGAETLRFTTHQLVLTHEFAAGAPWVTSVPRNDHLVAKYAGIYAAEVLVAYELKKPHSWLPGDKFIRKLWWAYPAAMVPIHIKNGVRSIRTQAPSCPPEECQSQ